MRKVVVGLLVLGTSVCFGAKPLNPCAVLLALRGLDLPPPPAALVRSVLDRLVVGEPSGRLMAPLRRATWPDGTRMPRLRRRVGNWDGYHNAAPYEPVVSIVIPRELLGTAVEVATVMHEHEHARIAHLLPEADALEQELIEDLEEAPFSRNAIDRAALLAEITWLHERHAMAAEYAIFRALRPHEREALRRRVEHLRAGLNAWDKEVLGASLCRGYRSFRAYVRQQDRADRYSQFDCLADALMTLFDLRGESDVTTPAERTARQLSHRYRWRDDW